MSIMPTNKRIITNQRFQKETVFGARLQTGIDTTG